MKSEKTVDEAMTKEDSRVDVESDEELDQVVRKSTEVNPNKFRIITNPDHLVQDSQTAHRIIQMNFERKLYTMVAVGGLLIFVAVIW